MLRNPTINSSQKKGVPRATLVYIFIAGFILGWILSAYSPPSFRISTLQSNQNERQNKAQSKALDSTDNAQVSSQDDSVNILEQQTNQLQNLTASGLDRNSNDKKIQDSVTKTTLSSNAKQVCLESLRPSEIEHWSELWSARVHNFLESNSMFWISRDHNQTPDLRIAKSVAGNYFGKLTFSVDRQVEAELKLLVKTDLDGHFKTSFKIAKEKGFISRNCNVDFSKKDGVEIDHVQAQLNVLFENCMKDTWPQYVHFAFKLPTNIRVGVEITLPIFALSEDLVWQDVGQIQLVKLN